MRGSISDRKRLAGGAGKHCLSAVSFAEQRYVNDLLDVLMFAELKQRVKAVDMLLKDGTITALEQRLRRLEKEVQHRGEERAIA